MAMRSKKVAIICMLMAASLAISSSGTMEEDEQECADQLTNLASCIPFVSGTAKKPTAQCCEDTQKVKASKPKCLCVLIKESADPSLGLPVNTALALQMPSACNIDAKVSDCPSILKLSPGSPDAKIFKEADAGSSSSSSASTNSTTASPSSGTSYSSPSTPQSDSKTVTPSSNDGAKEKILAGGKFFVVTMVLIAWILV